MAQVFKNHGSLWDRYQIYVHHAKSLGWEVKTFDQWLNS